MPKRSKFPSVVATILVTSGLLIGCGQDGQNADPTAKSVQGSTLLPVNVGLYYHSGYAVQDLDATMAQFSANLGLQWRPVSNATLNIRLWDGSVEPITFGVAFSVQGPPYIELVAATGEGAHPWKTGTNKSPNHIGYVVDNLVAASDALVAAGWPRIATVNRPGFSAFIFAYHEGPGGISIELVDRNFITVPGVCDTSGSQFCPQ